MKKLTALILCLVMLFACLSGCGNTVKPENTPEATVEPTEEPTETPEETPEPTPTPEPDTPQELADGEVWHYGRTTKEAVNFRKGPGTKYDTLGKVAKGTAVWVMEKDGDWCYVRVMLNGKKTDEYNDGTKQMKAIICFR